MSVENVVLRIKPEKEIMESSEVSEKRKEEVDDLELFEIPEEENI